MSAMDIFLMLTTLMGGLALFLYGMGLMSDSLTSMTGNGLRNVIEKLTKKKVSGYLFGTGITALVQSSSTTTVMVVGFVNAGVMTLIQAVNVILGANLGTTATAWLLSLNGIEGNNLVLALLKPANIAPFFAVGAVFCTMFTKKESIKRICSIIVGFSLLMMGMSIMGSAMKPLGDSPAFKSLLTSFENPFLSYFVAVIFTMIVQSCDATVGIIQALAMTTGVNYAVCIPMICGAQIGTCITSIISSIGTSRNGRRAAFLHLFYNIIKTVSFMAIYVVLNSIFHFPFLSMSASLVGIALIHSLINVAYSAFILPMSGLLVKLVNFVLPQTESEKDIDQVVSTLDPMLLKTAPFAIVQAKKVADMMARMVADIFTEIRGSVQKEDGNWEEVEKQCDMVLLYHDKLTDYMLKIGEDSLSNADSRRLMMVKDASTDLATIIKLYQSIYRSLRQIDRETYQFPKQSMGDIAVLFSAMEEVISLTTNGFQRDNPTFLKAIPAFREVIHSMKEIIVHKSIRLMQEGVYTYDQHTFVSETTHQFDRIIGCCDDIGRATRSAHWGKKKAKVTGEESDRQIEVVKRLLRDKFDSITEDIEVNTEQ